MGAVEPASFIPVAEAHGLARPLGEWVLRRTCAQIRSWQAQGLQVPVLAVNLSGPPVRAAPAAPAAHSMLANCSQSCGLSPDKLQLEITETFVMSQKEEALPVLQSLRELGLQLAIDDFGTGYSSLSYLNRLPPSTP